MVLHPTSIDLTQPAAAPAPAAVATPLAFSSITDEEKRVCIVPLNHINQSINQSIQSARIHMHCQRYVNVTEFPKQARQNSNATCCCLRRTRTCCCLATLSCKESIKEGALIHLDIHTHTHMCGCAQQLCNSCLAPIIWVGRLCVPSEVAGGARRARGRTSNTRCTRCVSRGDSLLLEVSVTSVG